MYEDTILVDDSVIVIDKPTTKIKRSVSLRGDPSNPVTYCAGFTVASTLGQFAGPSGNAFSLSKKAGQRNMFVDMVKAYGSRPWEQTAKAPFSAGTSSLRQMIFGRPLDR